MSDTGTIRYQFRMGQTAAEVAKALRLAAALSPQGGVITVPMTTGDALNLAKILDQLGSLQEAEAGADAALRALKNQSQQIADYVSEMKRLQRRAWVKLGVELTWFTAALIVLAWVTA